jgi:hypothetical protein
LPADAADGTGSGPCITVFATGLPAPFDGAASSRGSSGFSTRRELPSNTERSSIDSVRMNDLALDDSALQLHPDRPDGALEAAADGPARAAAFFTLQRRC